MTIDDERLFITIDTIKTMGISSSMVHSHGGAPSSLVGLFHGKSIYKWMMTGGTPISGNLHMEILEHMQETSLQSMESWKNINQSMEIWKNMNQSMEIWKI